MVPIGTGVTERTRIRRLPERAVRDTAVRDRILDEGLVCHVGFALDGQPYVIPTGYARTGDRLVLHGSRGSRTLRALAGGLEVCVTVTLLDGLVLARSAFHHSMNYRSVVVFGTATPLHADEKLAALRVLTDHLVPGRWDDVRPPDRRELAATSVLSVPLDDWSVKARTGPPVDEERDHALSAWAGVLPLSLEPGAPVPDDGLPAGIRTPAHVTAYRRPQG